MTFWGARRDEENINHVSQPNHEYYRRTMFTVFYQTRRYILNACLLSKIPFRISCQRIRMQKAIQTCKKKKKCEEKGSKLITFCPTTFRCPQRFGV